MASLETAQRRTGVSYRVKWRDGGRDGKPETVSFDDARLAKRFQSLVTANGNRWPTPVVLRESGFGKLPQARSDEISDSRITLVDATVAYLTTGRTVKRANTDTVGEYVDQVDLYLRPHFASTLLVDVHRAQLSAWQDWMTDVKGLAPKTIANIRGSLLNPVLKRAMMRGDHGEPPLRDYNPLDGLALPERRTKYVRAMLHSKTEADIFLAAALQIDPDAHDLLLTKLGVGMRWGEVAGLPPQAVTINPDTFKGTIEIVQVAVRRRGKREPGEPLWYLREYPKTPAGFRTLPVHPRVGKVLLARLQTATDLIFTNTAGKLWYSSTFHTHRWTPILELARRNGLPRDITPHGLRKSLISLLYENKVDPVTTANMSGHADPSTGLRLYTSPTERQHDEVRDVVGAGLLGVA